MKTIQGGVTSSTETNRQVSSAVKLALLAGSVPFLAAANTAFAQESVESIDVVTVTGSRITNPNLDQASQIQVVSEEEIAIRQAIDAEGLIGELPGMAPGINNSINNGSSGGAFLNLRGLGTNRSLVLLDGQRMVPADLRSRTDLNSIPVALVERVDIVTGGASSVYGADAVAGVTNFITKRNFEGLEIASTYGLTAEDDGRTIRYDVTLGGNFAEDRGNVAINIGYQEQDGILQGDREISQQTQFGSLVGLGSGTSTPTSVSGTQYDPATGGFRATASTFNYAPFNYFQTPFERFNVFGKAHYEVTDNIEVYTNAMYTRNTVKLQLAPSGLFGDTWQMPLSNPFLTPTVRNAICAGALTPIDQATCDAAGAAVNSQDANYLEVPVVLNRRLVEQGNRQTDYVTNSFQLTMGTRGDITDNIQFDVYGQYGESDRTQTNLNWGLKSLLQQSLRATDAATCDATTSPSGGCVPINLFGGGDGLNISQGTVDFWSKPNGVTVSTSLGVFNAGLSGELDFSDFLPTDLPIGWAAGYEYRRYTASQNADVAAATQDEVLGTGAPDPLFSGDFDVNEFFLETIVPIVTDKPGIQALTFEAGVRFSDYSTSGNATTFKAGGTWAVNDNIKVRGIFQEASRSPNIFELFNPPTTGLNNNPFDPCQGLLADGLTPNPALNNPDVVAICQAQGAPAAAIANGIPQPSAGQINETQGGNTALDVETAESLTFGFIITPTAIPDLTVSIDYYDIEITDAITAPTPADIFDPCFGPGAAGDAFASANPASPSCALIGRNPLNGSLNGGGDTAGIITQFTNQGILQTSGIDVRVTYD